MLKNELSTTQDRNKTQTDELNRLQEQIVVLKVDQASLQEKCRLALEEVKSLPLLMTLYLSV